MADWPKGDGGSFTSGTDWANIPALSAPANTTTESTEPTRMHVLLENASAHSIRGADVRYDGRPATLGRWQVVALEFFSDEFLPGILLGRDCLCEPLTGPYWTHR